MQPIIQAKFLGMLPLTGLSGQANPALGSDSVRRRSLTSFGMTNPLGVILSGSEKSFSTQKQTMILIEPLPCADNYAKQLALTRSPNPTGGSLWTKSRRQFPDAAF